MKIAFDEEYGKYSPGVQLEFHVIRRALANPNIEFMDLLGPDHIQLHHTLVAQF